MGKRRVYYVVRRDAVPTSYMFDIPEFASTVSRQCTRRPKALAIATALYLEGYRPEGIFIQKMRRIGKKSKRIESTEYPFVKGEKRDGHD